MCHMRDDSSTGPAGQELLEVFFAQSADAFFAVEPHDESTACTIVDCNDAACRLYGYTREQFIGMSLAALSAAHMTTATQDALTQARRAGQARLETAHRRSDGTTLAV